MAFFPSFAGVKSSYSNVSFLLHRQIPLSVDSLRAASNPSPFDIMLGYSLPPHLRVAPGPRCMSVRPLRFLLFPQDGRLLPLSEASRSD